MNCRGEWGGGRCVLLGTQNALWDLTFRGFFFLPQQPDSKLFCVAHDDLELLILLSPPHKSWDHSVCHNAWFVQGGGANPGPCLCQANTLPTELHLWLLGWLFRGKQTFQVAGDSHMRAPACKFLAFLW